MVAKKDKRRMIIIGLDGVPYGAIKSLTSMGVMKNLARIIEEGVFRQMTSSIPEVSSVAWSSIITGRNPGEHGIYGFMDLTPGTYRLHFPNFFNLKASPFWNTDGSKRSVIINVPSTYPVRELNGVLISGFVALNINKAIYPPDLIPKLMEMDYQIDVDSNRAHKSMNLFLRDLDKTLKARIEAYRYLWNSEQWDTFMLVFTGTDRLFHFLWDAYMDSAHRYHEIVLDHFRQIDEAIGEILHRMEDNDNLLLLSDHGFEALDVDVNINYYLRENGFLRLTDGTGENFTNIGSRTKAFALDPSRIYVNLEGRYPAGSVKPGDKERVIEDLISLFDSLEIDTIKVIKRIFRSQEIYHGTYLDQGPDLVLLSNKGLNLRANIKAKTLFDKGIFKGKHSQDNAFLVVKGRGNEAIVPEMPTVADIVSIKDKLILKRR